jgi:hypothetical protein
MYEVNRMKKLKYFLLLFVATFVLAQNETNITSPQLDSYGKRFLENWPKDYEAVFVLLLPFLLSFAIYFGILENSKLFEANRQIHVVIALCAALFTLYYASREPTLLDFIYQFIASMTIIFIYMVFSSMFVTFIFALLKHPAIDIVQSPDVRVLVFLLLFGVVYIVAASAQMFSVGALEKLNILDPNHQTLAWLLVIFSGILLLIKWLTKPAPLQNDVSIPEKK